MKQVLAASNQKEVERYKVVSRTLPNVLPCCRRLVLTNDESGKAEDGHGTIEIMPVWKWLLT